MEPDTQRYSRRKGDNVSKNYVLAAIVVLSVGSVVAVLVLLVTIADTSDALTRSGIILGVVTPTVAALLALLRAEEVKQVAKAVDEKLDTVVTRQDERHDENVERLEHIEKKVGNGV